MTAALVATLDVQKAQYRASKGSKPKRLVVVLVCPKCKRTDITFRKNERGILAHFNCPEASKQTEEIRPVGERWGLPG